MFQAYKRKQTTTNYRKKMNAPLGKATGSGIFKHRDIAYLAWLKRQLDEKETRDKLISIRNDIVEANKRINYRNQIDRINNDIQRDSLNHNFLEHLQHQIIQFRNLNFTYFFQNSYLD